MAVIFDPLSKLPSFVDGVAYVWGKGFFVLVCMVYAKVKLSGTRQSGAPFQEHEYVCPGVWAPITPVLCIEDCDGCFCGCDAHVSDLLPKGKWPPFPRATYLLSSMYRTEHSTFKYFWVFLGTYLHNRVSSASCYRICGWAFGIRWFRPCGPRECVRSVHTSRLRCLSRSSTRSRYAHAWRSSGLSLPSAASRASVGCFP
jgi:hypothetical protein